MKLLTLIKPITTLAVITLLTACSSKPSGPVFDKYEINDFVWDDKKSDALNLLKSADMDKYFRDIDDEDDFNDVRYRKSTAKSVFDYALGFAGFGIAGLLNNAANHEDDINRKFLGTSYVTYVPVNKKELSNYEQKEIRDEAVARFSKLVNTKDTVNNWKTRSGSTYIVKLSGEACELRGDAFTGTTLEKSGCITMVTVNVVSIVNAKSIKLLHDKNTNDWFATVRVSIPAPFAAITAAKNVDNDSFVAFNDFYKTYNTTTINYTPIVVISDKILTFYNPKKNIGDELEKNKPLTTVCIKEKQICYKTSIVTGNKELTKELYSKK